MMNLIVLTILGLILLSSSAMAQESVPIEGRVVVPDGKKGRGLASIKVVLNGGEYRL